MDVGIRILCSRTSPFKFVMNKDSWGDTAVQLPKDLPAEWAQNVFTGKRLSFQNHQISVVDVFEDFPVALLLTETNARIQQ